MLETSIENRQEQYKFNHELRAREDFVTWAAEALDGSMRSSTSFEYNATTNELYADDGSGLGSIFEDALRYADKLVATKPQLAFERRRRAEELQEYHDMKAMMRGELPGVMVVVSDFPEELMNYGASVGGYNAQRKQTFVRVIVRDGSRLDMRSQTLDGSDRAALEAIYSSLGFAPEGGELLGQRMHIDVPLKDIDALTSQIVETYDQALQQKTGKRYSAGREQHLSQINTYDFVNQQQDIVTRAVRDTLAGRMTDSAQYNIISLLDQRYHESSKLGHTDFAVQAHYETSIGGYVTKEAYLSQQLEFAGQQAQSEGKSFSGCGSTIGAAQGDNIAESLLSSLGFGEKSETYSFNAYQFCVSCQAPPKEKEKKKMCGPCGLCRGCDKKAGGKG